LYEGQFLVLYVVGDQLLMLASYHAGFKQGIPHTICATKPVAAGDVAQVEVSTFAESTALFPGLPETTSQAQYSLPFGLAALLVHGKIGPNEISGATLAHPDVAAMLPRIAVREEARYSQRFPGGRWSDVTVTLKDGRVLASGEVHARGGPEAPMALAEVLSKFRVMASALPDARIAALAQMRERLLQPEATFGELARLVRAPVEAPHD
jgi:2-methylcitrate dehydratase PrpD